MPENTGEIRNEDGTFKKGVTGNPNGRPKGSYSIVEMIKKKLQEMPEGKDKTYGEYFVEQIMKKAVIEGDVTMMKDLTDRIDGKPRQNIGLDGGEEGKELVISWLPYKSITDQETGQTSSITPPQDG